jgi:hypothetical protein
MGNNIDCCLDEKIKYENNKKIYQINRLIKEKEKDNSTSNSSNGNEELNNILSTGTYQLLSYDIEENILIPFSIKIPIITSLNGLSELNFNSKLYLCGTSSSKEDASSYLFQISSEPLNTQIMVSSQYGHYYPSLISINKNKIACIGGKNQTQCEIYDISINHWSIIPELPEERYKCNLCFDYIKKFLYLFGGINNSKNIYANYIEKETVLRLNTKNSCYNSWEKIFIDSKLENKLLTRVSSASLLIDDNHIILIGGENENGKILKNIIKFNLTDYSVNSTGKCLDFPSKFMNQSTIIDDNNESNIYYFFDSKNNIHNINKQQYESGLKLNIN